MCPLPPGPHGHFLWGNFREYQKDVLGYFQKCRRDFGHVVRTSLGSTWITQVTHPEDVHRVLLDHRKNFSKETSVKIVKRYLGEGLFTSKGPLWQKQRRIFQPVFDPEQIHGLVPLMSGAVYDLLDRWHLSTGPVDVCKEMSLLAMDIASRCMFGASISEQQLARLRFSHELANEAMMGSFRSFFRWPLFIPTAENKKMKEALKQNNAVVSELVTASKSQDSGQKNLVSLLLKVKDSDGQSLSDDEIRDQITTLLFISQETTASMLSWFWYLVSQHPTAYRDIVDEVSGALRGGSPTSSDLEVLPYTTASIRETLRLYPPSYVIARDTLNDDILGGYFIPKGETIAILPFITHRDEQFWTLPEAFCPERFLTDDLFRDHPGYFPFGLGPRGCIGHNLAMKQALTVVSMIACRYEMEFLSDNPIEPKPLMTLAPLGPIPMRIRKRSVRKRPQLTLIQGMRG